MSALDKTAARRIQTGVERFAETGSGNIKRLQGSEPPEYRLLVGDWRVRFHRTEKIIRILRVLHRREAYR
jgi:mRNA-degrading endonuclease RelE of RelBE toxin-antitoxin system